jgi:hypothetical protein
MQLRRDYSAENPLSKCCRNRFSRTAACLSANPRAMSRTGHAGHFSKSFPEHRRLMRATISLTWAAGAPVCVIAGWTLTQLGNHIPASTVAPGAADPPSGVVHPVRIDLAAARAGPDDVAADVQHGRLIHEQVRRGASNVYHVCRLARFARFTLSVQKALGIRCRRAIWSDTE